MKKALKRFVDIWRIDFLAKFLAGESNDNKTTVIFWILSNFVLSLIIAISFCFFMYGSLGVIIDSIETNVPENARVILVDGQLTTENIEEPFFREIDAHDEGDVHGGVYAIIIDTHSETYDLTSLDEYDGGIVVLNDRAYIKDGADLDHAVFSDIPNFSISKDEVLEFVKKYFMFPFSIVLTVFIGMFMFMWFAVFRLLGAFWWAFLLFILTKIVNIECGYMTAYKSVLNFYFIPTIVVFMIGFAGFSFPLMTTVIFIAIFVANLVWIKKHPQTDELETVMSELPEIKKVETVK